MGLGFLTKMLQAFLVLPAFGLVYLLAAPTGLGRRLLHLGGAVLAVIVSAGWYIAVADLSPASSRPYIGGSTNNTVLDLALGYNGLSFTTSDPSPTLEQFEQYVADGQIHYFIAGGNEIATWVAENFTASTVGGQTVYDLTS